VKNGKRFLECRGTTAIKIFIKLQYESGAAVTEQQFTHFGNQDIILLQEIFLYEFKYSALR